MTTPIVGGLASSTAFNEPEAVFLRDRSRKSVLHYCSGQRDLVAAASIAVAAPELLESADEDGFTPLHLAVIQGNIAMVNLLLANKADVNALDNEGHSVVHWATVCGEVEALRAVLAAGATVTTPDINGGSPLHYAAQMCGANYEGNLGKASSKLALEILDILISHPNSSVDVADKDGRQPLLWAASAGSAKAIISLINAGARVECADKDGLTALHCAASRGHTECIDTLISLCGAPTDLIDSNGCTALHYAVTLGHADATARLLELEADPNRQDRKGRTPAHCGCAKGQFETVKLLKEKGANLWLRNAKGDLPVHEAASSGRRELVEWLLEQRPKHVNTTCNDGRTLLHIAATNDYTDMCKMLLDFGAEINCIHRNCKGQVFTPLDCSLQKGHRSTAKFLQLNGGLPASKLHLSARRPNAFNDQELVKPLKYEKKDVQEIKTGKKYIIYVRQSDSECSCSEYVLHKQRKHQPHVCQEHRKRARRRTSSCGEAEDITKDDSCSDICRSKSNIEIRRKRSKDRSCSSSSEEEDSCENCCRHKKKLKRIKKRGKYSKKSKEHIFSPRDYSSREALEMAKSDDALYKEQPIAKPEKVLTFTVGNLPVPLQSVETDMPVPDTENAAKQSGQNVENEVVKVTTIVTEAEIHAVNDADLAAEKPSVESEKPVSMEEKAAIQVDSKQDLAEQIDLVLQDASIAVDKAETTITSEKVSADHAAEASDAVEKVDAGETADTVKSASTDEATDVAKAADAVEPIQPVENIAIGESSGSGQDVNVQEKSNEPDSVIATHCTLETEQENKPPVEEKTDEMEQHSLVEKDQKPLIEAETTEKEVPIDDEKTVEAAEEPAFQDTTLLQASAAETVTGGEATCLAAETVEAPRQSVNEDSMLTSEKIAGKPHEEATQDASKIEQPDHSQPAQDKEHRRSFTVISSPPQEEKSPRKSSFTVLKSDESIDVEDAVASFDQDDQPSFQFISAKSPKAHSDDEYTSDEAEEEEDVDNMTAHIKRAAGATTRFTKHAGAASFQDFNNRKRRLKKRIKPSEKPRAWSSIGAPIHQGSKDQDSGFEPSPRTMKTKIPSPRIIHTAVPPRRPIYATLDNRSCSSRLENRKLGDRNACNMTAVTKSIQKNMRRYYMERKIFQHLLELKSLQIRSSKLNEAVLVKRAVDDYHKSCMALGVETGGSLRRYPYTDYTFKNFEMFLYETLKSLQKSGSNNFQNIEEVYQEAERRLSPDYNTYEKALQCTTKTHRCFHAAHAYTGIPCAAYIPFINHHTIPKFGFGPYKKTGIGSFYLPKILTGHAKGGSKVSLELSHGRSKQLIPLPSEKLDSNKRYYVTFTVKGSEAGEKGLRQTTENVAAADGGAKE
ncbi:ankycorbin isoform X2 [Hermetia illucens]|uniref:ankycorbin isoform X2 n=1 Tax=Hermetia illucens TaxID=343691 RepID=UPI0018CC1A7B|nr:ankycorbin isoform X2 [Hermetia illucens]